MPRATKESEDESEVKIGRRTRSVALPVVDSPLRRSTRRKQPASQQDDESSPESIASDATGPPARSTRRRTTTAEFPSSDNTRFLRSRKNSTASDTSEFMDAEIPGEVKRRITRRSVAAIPTAETPTKSRLRSTTRAGSESKTMSPSVQTSRRTRASSVDLEESNEIPRDKLSLMQLGTPLKTRSRASVLPSEPSVIEESDISSKEFQDDIQDVPEETSSSSYENKTPVMRLKFDDSRESEEAEVDGSSTEVSVMDSTKISVENLDGSSNSLLFKLRDQLVSESNGKSIIISPKVVLNKADVPIQKSPGNKENEKSNIIQSDKKLEIFQSNNTVSQRKTQSFGIVKKSSIDDRLNKSTDEHLLANIDNSSKSRVSSSNKIQKFERIDQSVIALVNTETASVPISSSNNSNISVEKSVPNDQKETIVDSNDDNMICIEPKKQRKSLENDSQEPVENDSVYEAEVIIDNLTDDSSVYSTHNLSNGAKEQDHELSTTPNDDDKSESSVTKSFMASASDLLNTTPTNNIDTAEINSTSIEETIKDSEEDEKQMKSNKRRSSLVQERSRSKTPQSPVKILKANQNSTTDDSFYDDVEDDLENLFKDILAEEWQIDKANKIGIDNDQDANNEIKEKMNDGEVAADKKSSEIVKKISGLKSQDTSDYDSDETIITLSTKMSLETSKNLVKPTIIVEKSMKVDNDEDADTEIDQTTQSSIVQVRKKSLNKSRRSSLVSLSGTNNFDKDDDECKVVNEDMLSNSDNKSDEGNSLSMKTQTTGSNDIEKNMSTSKLSKNAPRRSFNVKSQESNTNKKLKRRTIEAMDSSKFHELSEKENSNISSADTGDDKNDEKTKSATKSPAKRQSSSGFTQKKAVIEDLINTDTDDDSDTQLANNSILEIKKSVETSKSKKNKSVIIETNSSSERRYSNGANRNNREVAIPSFLLNSSDSSDDDDDDNDASVNSDIAREINLNGNNILKYSDDDVPGDECRASETESSFDEDDDDDMADFIVDNDEDIDEENESSEENVSADEDAEMNLDESHENINDNSIPSKIRSKKLLETSSSEDEEQEKEENKTESIDNKSPQEKEKIISRRSSISKTAVTDSLNNSTPKITKEISSSESISTTPEVVSAKKAKKNRTSISDESHFEFESRSIAMKVINTPTNVENECQKLQSSSAKKSSTKKQAKTNNTILAQSKSVTNTPSNQSMFTLSSVSPEMKLLMQEKLNESLPAMKLQRRSLKSSRRNSLLDVKETLDEEHDASPEELKIEHEPCVNSIDKKKKKKKKTSLNSVVENMNVENPNELADVEHQVIENDLKKKMKKKKKGKNEKENDTTVSEYEQPKKKKQKQNDEVVNNATIIEKKTQKRKLKCTSESDNDSSLPASLEQAQLLMDNENATTAIKKSKNKKLKDKSEKRDDKESPAVNNIVISKKSNIKRLPDDVLENISDVPLQPKKRRKLESQVFPSTTMFDSKNSKPDNLSIENVDYIPLSGSGGTSQFSVVNLKKFPAKHSKKSSAAWSFRERMLARNRYQPVSAYLMYQQKLKASKNDKF